MKLKSLLKNKKGQIQQLPGFFQLIMLVIIVLGLTFIVLDKFLDIATSGSLAETAINETTWALYDYGVAFLGVIILVVMVYLIISIISGRQTTGGKGAR